MTYAQLPLTPEGVQQFMKKLRGDDALRQEVIRLIESEGSLAMIKKYFTPNGKQQKMVASFAKVMNAALVDALSTKGDITMSQSNQESPGGHIGVSVGANGSVAVEIDCHL